MSKFVQGPYDLYDGARQEKRAKRLSVRSPTVWRPSYQSSLALADASRATPASHASSCPRIARKGLQLALYVDSVRQHRLLKSPLLLAKRGQEDLALAAVV